MQELRLCMECNTEKNVACFHTFTVNDTDSVKIVYSSKCEQCKDKKMKETKIGRMNEEEVKDYNRQCIKKLREDPEYRKKER